MPTVPPSSPTTPPFAAAPPFLCRASLTLLPLPPPPSPSLCHTSAAAAPSGTACRPMWLHACSACDAQGLEPPRRRASLVPMAAPLWMDGGREVQQWRREGGRRDSRGRRGDDGESCGGGGARNGCNTGLASCTTARPCPPPISQRPGSFLLRSDYFTCRLGYHVR